MIHKWLLYVSVVAIAGGAGMSVPAARAAYLDARFSGPVMTGKGTAAPAIGSVVSGEFVYSTDSKTFLSFTINGFSAAPGARSTATLTPDDYSATFQVQLSPVQQGGTSNSTLTVDLEGLNPWPGPSAASVLTSSGLQGNLDITASSFGYYTANADGTNVRSASADLTSLSVSVPEPASLGLLAMGILAVAVRRSRR